MKKLLREPLFHFFLLGAVLFAAHRARVGQPRVIVVTPGLEADLARHLRDREGRAPTPAEREAAVEAWKRDEALSREARREGLDRDDASVRALLVDRMRSQIAREVPKRVPSEADLEAWLAAHRGSYERPLRYALSWAPFAKEEPRAAEAREVFERATRAAADVRALGRPVYAANLTADEVKERFGPRLAGELPQLPKGRWARSETEKDLLLVRVTDEEGGLPPPAELRSRLVADWAAAQQKEDVDRAIEGVVRRYRFERREGPE